MDRGSLLTLRKPIVQSNPAKRKVQPIRWTIMERILGFISPPVLDRKFKGDAPLSDTWDYHYRTNRKGKDYPTPDEDACIVPEVKPTPRTATQIFQMHIAACRRCSEAMLNEDSLCIVGDELERRMQRIGRRASHYGEDSGIYVNGRRTP